jgi:Major Facilitator Superfamily
MFWLGIIVFFLPETRGSVILRRRVRKMRAKTGDKSLVAVGDESRLSLAKLIKISTTRPLMLLFTEHIVFWFSLWVSFAWGILYLFLTAVSFVFRETYHFTPEQVGLAFIGMTVGGLLGFAASPVQDYIFSRLASKNHGKPTPEARLYFSCIGSIMFPAGVFWFGWSSRANVHWIVPTIAVGWTTVAIYFIYVSPKEDFADLDCGV